MTEAINLTLWRLFIDINYQFDITNMVCIDFYLWDWKVTWRKPKFWHRIGEKGNQLSWNALGCVRESRNFEISEFDITKFTCIYNRLMTFLKVETDITSIWGSPIGRDAKPVIIYVETFNTKITVFICNTIMSYYN